MLTSNSGTYSERSLHYITFDYYKRVLCYVVVLLSDSAHCKFALQPKSSTLSSFFRDRIACEARIVIFFFKKKECENSCRKCKIEAFFQRRNNGCWALFVCLFNVVCVSLVCLQFGNRLTLPKVSNITGIRRYLSFCCCCCCC